jgi:PAS domain S-box-containing protein
MEPEITGDNDPRQHSDLRRRAEQQVRSNKAAVPNTPSPEETDRLLHELQVHQIELELQNEELCRAQAELAIAHARYFDLYDLAPVGYLTLSEKGLITAANMMAAILLGMERSVLINQPLTRFIYPDDQDIYYLHRKKLLDAGEPQAIDIRLLQAGSAPFWAHLDATVARNADGVLECRVVLSDIGERKKIDERIRKAYDELDARVSERTFELEESRKELRELAQHLQSIREDERLKISREIHDELGQTLTALKLDLDFIRKGLPEEQKAIYDKIVADIYLVEEIILLIKRICDELRPSILDHFGIEAAIEWQAEEFEKSTGIICSLTLSPGDYDIGVDRSTALFRIFQEALTNVARHSGATRVSVRLSRVNDSIELEIKDNGMGISPEQGFKPKSFGLLGMRERVYELKGNIEIAMAEGSGVVIRATIPAL